MPRGIWASLPIKFLVSLYKNGLSTLVIGKRFGVSYATVGRRLKAAGVPLRPAQRTLPGVLNLSKKKHEAFVELIDGLLLGDGSLTPNGYLMVGQTDRRVGWLHQIVKELRRFGCAADVRSHDVEKDIWIRGKKYRAKSSSILSTPVYEELKVQRARWYTSGPAKRVPHDVRVSPKSIAHWFAGDGSSDRYGHLLFCTNSFTAAEVEHLARKLPVEAHRLPIPARPGQSIIHITKRNEAVKLANAIRRYLPNCCMYKLRFVRSAKAIRSPMQASTVRSLRRLYATGKWSQQALGDRFGVGQTEVSDVVLWRTFKKIA